MDDIWLPIMHSAMDPRSNTSLLAVMTDALKETEFSCDSELSTQSDMWQNGSLQGKWKQNAQRSEKTKWLPWLPLGKTFKAEPMREWSHEWKHYRIPWTSFRTTECHGYWTSMSPQRRNMWEFHDSYRISKRPVRSLKAFCPPSPFLRRDRERRGRRLRILLGHFYHSMYNCTANPSIPSGNKSTERKREKKTWHVKQQHQTFSFLAGVCMFVYLSMYGWVFEGTHAFWIIEE